MFHNGHIFKKLFFSSQILFLMSLGLALKKTIYFYKLALARNKKKTDLLRLFNFSYEKKLLKNISTQKKISANQTQQKKINMTYQDIFISSFDKLKLHATLITQKNNLYKNNWVIIIHGYNGFGLQMLHIAKEFYKLNFNIILPDCRGHGKSDGNYIGMGWHDRLDILEWIKFITKKNPQAKIILYGLSMGGAAVLMTSGENLPANIKCIIEDCAYTSVLDEFFYHYNKIFNLPKFLLNLTDIICQTKSGYKLSEASAINQLKKCKTPVLFIHGAQDRFVPTKMVYKLYKSATCPKDILIIPKAGHGLSYQIKAKKYFQKIQSFIKKYF